MILKDGINRCEFAETVADVLAKLQIQKEKGSMSEGILDRWIKAIAKATVEFENNPFLNWDSDSKHLILWNQASNQIYEANGTCQCKAFLGGNPCYHRALARLIQRHLERVH